MANVVFCDSIHTSENEIIERMYKITSWHETEGGIPLKLFDNALEDVFITLDWTARNVNGYLSTSICRATVSS